MSDLVVGLRKVAMGSVIPGKVTASQKEYLDGVYTIMLSAAERIEELEAQIPKWISVKDRLPDEFKKDYLVLIKVKDGDGEDDFFEVIEVHGWFNDTKEWGGFDGLGLREMEEVTHWMPLPEQPEGSND